MGGMVQLLQWLRKAAGKAADWGATLVLLAGFFLFSWLAYKTYSDYESGVRTEEALEWMKFYAYLVGGIVLIWQVRISNRRASALEKTAALGEKGNITERFKNAVEHLGNASESVRMGGIYALYHVARESSEYVETVKEILRSHTNVIMAGPEYAKRDKPSNEVAAILNVLFPVIDIMKPHTEALFKNMEISNWNLRGADLWKRNMKGVQGINANLSEAQLREANLSDAFLWGSNFSRVDFVKANLSGAYLQRVDLSRATMTYADLSGAHLSQVSFLGAHMGRVDLSGAYAETLDLSGAFLYGANLSGMRKISVEQLLEARTLRGAKLDDHIRQEIQRRKPELLLE